ncbi:MAG: hypothetical protein M0Z66_15970 [Thermaerobacter sp.]|nr:hypothetical protein [Thermaerobacter sp.]
MPAKIAIIGAGSGMFSLSLVKDICLASGLRGSTVSFMDINEERLENAYQVSVRYARQLNADLHLERTTDRRAALKDADFVINTALHESHEHWREGWQIAKKHGYRFGGSFHIVHDEAFWINFYQFGLMESILKDMQELCPKAWYVVVANPVMAGVTYLTRKYPDAKIVGLCHGYRQIYAIADKIGIDPDQMTYEIPGINHFVWLVDFRYRGDDAFHLIDEWIEQHAEEHWRDCVVSDDLGPKVIDLYKRFGVFPIGDTATTGGGAWAYWYHTNSDVQARWKEDPDEWFVRYFQEAADVYGAFETATKVSDEELLKLFPPKLSGETIIPLVESLATDQPRVLIVNVPNTGSYVPGIPTDFAVEIPALVSGRGIQGIQTHGLPRPLLAHALRDRVAPVEAEIYAYEHGDYESLLQMVLMDPWTQSEDQARGLLKDILDLPYHREMLEHYHSRAERLGR